MSSPRGSLQHQFLLPAAVWLGIVVLIMCLASSSYLKRIMRRDAERTVARLERTVRESAFPLTSNVLEKLRGISGAHFVVWSPSGEIVSTTFQESSIADQLRPHLHTHLGTEGISGAPAVSLSGESYYLKLSRHSIPSDEAVMILYPQGELWKVEIWGILIPLIPGTLGITAILVLFGLRTQTLGRRLTEIRERVLDIGEGDFVDASGEEGTDEIGELTAAVNRMSGQIRTMRDLIGRTERSRVLGQLAGGLAHQMRNALTGIRLAIQIHERRCLTSKEEESLQVALKQLNVLEEHVKRLLSVGKHEKRSINWFHVRRLLEEVETLAEPFCKHSRVEIDRCVPSLKVLQIHGDYEGLRNALLNLVMNGIEAAGSGGQVEVKGYPDGDEIVFEVLDNGPGPLPSISSQLFEPFVSGKSEGIGLGLAVVRQTAISHQGSAMWERIEGRTCFRIRLPKIPVRIFGSEPEEISTAGPELSRTMGDDARLSERIER